jgi:hypothetical protein
MSERNQLAQIRQLFDALFPMSDAGRDRYLTLNSDLPSSVVRQTLSMLQPDDGKNPLPSLNALLQ